MNSNKNDAEKLPDGWVLCSSKSNPGRKYYFNRKTGKSSWTQPKDEEKPVKRNVKQKGKREKAKPAATAFAEKKKEETQKKCVKRKSNDPTSPVKKRTKQEVPEKLNTPKKIVTVQQIAGGLKRKANEVVTKTSPRRSLNKNTASNRLSSLQEQLQAEVKALKEQKESPRNRNRQKASPATSESPAKVAKIDKSPIQNELRSATIQSPTNDSVQSTPSPSQFLAANKIISSMKDQLPKEHSDKSKVKSTFASIEEGICNQVTEYPYMKHPGTPPQFSEASKLVSAIKSKLSYRAPPAKDVSVLTFTSASDRLQTLRSRLSEEAQNVSEITDQDYLSRIVLPVEKMDVEEFRETKQNVPAMEVTNEAVNIKDNVVLVVDTNIFIYELNVIKNVLNSHIRGYTQQPTLLVPWRVINELDRLKDNNNGNGAICKPARCAMDYLYKSLPENDRIKGQSLRDANSHIYPCESPDDEILNCCLQQAERGKSVILLSNDKNLCNKANINGVKCIALAELKPLLENRPEPSADPDLYASVKHYEDTMYRLLSNILENEMRAKYNNLWQHVVFKPPPWTFLDVITCLLKHWIAVFNEVFPRIEHLFSDLKATFTSIQSKGPDSLGQSEVSTFKELCLEIAKKCQIIPEYMELAKATVERLQKKKDETSSSSNGGELMVISAFEGLWTVFSSYCSKLSSALGIPHNLDDKLPGSDTLEDLSSKWSDFSGQLRELTFAIKNSFSIDNSDPNSQQLNYFEAVFRKSLKLLSLDDTGITHDNIIIFCFNCKNMLREAHAKFTELVELLDVCRNNISNM